MQVTMWSNSFEKKSHNIWNCTCYVLLKSYLKSSSAAKEKHKYLFSCSLHHLYGNGIDLVVHLNCSPFTAADFD